MKVAYNVIIPLLKVFFLMAILSSYLYSDFREKIKDKTALPGQIQMKIKKNKIFRLTRVVRSTAVVELSIDWLGSALCSGEGNLQTIN